MDGLNHSVITGKCLGCAALKAKLKEARERLAGVEAHLIAQSSTRFRNAEASYEVIYHIIHPKEVSDG